MRKISEGLRLRAQGLSIWETAASVGVGRSTVGEYLRRAEVAGLGCPLPEGLGEEGAEARSSSPCRFGLPWRLSPTVGRAAVLAR